MILIGLAILGLLVHGLVSFRKGENKMVTMLDYIHEEKQLYQRFLKRMIRHFMCLIKTCNTF